MSASIFLPVDETKLRRRGRGNRKEMRRKVGKE